MGRDRETDGDFFQFGAAALRGCTRKNETSIGVKMSDETRMNNASDLPDDLPADLQALESSLAGMTIPESKLNRDELMYQSGWAAAMAELDSRSETETKLAVARNSTALSWAWPVATVVATAASVLFGGLLLWQSFSGTGPSFAQSDDENPSSVAAVNELPVSVAADLKESPLASDSNLNRDQNNFLAPGKFLAQNNLLETLMALPSNRKLAAGFVLFEGPSDFPAQLPDDDVEVPDSNSTVSPIPPTKTRFEMMKKLLTPATQTRSSYL